MNFNYNTNFKLDLKIKFTTLQFCLQLQLQLQLHRYTDFEAHCRQQNFIFKNNKTATGPSAHAKNMNNSLPRLQVQGHCFWSFAQAHLFRVLHVLAQFIILESKILQN